MTAFHVIECGWQQGRFYAGREKGTVLKWVEDPHGAVGFPSSMEAAHYAQTVLRLDEKGYKVVPRTP